MRSIRAAYTEGLGDPPNHDAARISWSRGLLKDHGRNIRHEYRPDAVRTSLYRPFTKEYSYFDRAMNDMVYRMPSMFPTAKTPNVGFAVIAPHPKAQFSVLGANELVDCATYVNAAQFFPRWTYEPAPKRAEPDGLFDLGGEVIDGYRRIDNITDSALATYRGAFGKQVSKDDIFSYVYGVLHSTQYRDRFAADLKKMLPRIPLAATPEDFRAFADAGAELMRLHIDYETVDPYPLEEYVTSVLGLPEFDLYAVSAKMKFPKVKGQADRSTLIYNQHITLRSIPEEAHRYQLGSRSALEWIIDRYWVRTDKASGIVNDPNDWSREHDDPRYIIDLVKRVVTVSVETMRIVDSLPGLPLDRTT